MCTSSRGAARLAGPRQSSGQPCLGSAEPLMSRGIPSARAAGPYRQNRALGRGSVRPSRARLPHHVLEKLAAAPAAVARLLGKPATLLWPASSTNPTYSFNHSGADAVAPYVEVLMATVMSGSRRLSRAAGRPAQPGRSGWCRRHGGRGSCGSRAQPSTIARHGMAFSPRLVRVFANDTSRK